MNSNDEIKTVKAAEKAEETEDNTITLSTGVVLRAKPVPPTMLVKIYAAFPRPKVPVYMNEKMGREMENADDPDYLERIKAWKVESSNVVLNAIILYGTELERCPKAIPHYASDKWLDRYRLLGQPTMPENEHWRYLIWMTTIAAPDTKDIALIQERVGRLSGILETQVAAASQFPAGDES